jgi:nitric oxide reductase NorQ protein
MNEVPGIPAEIAAKLVATGGKARGLKDHGLDEVTSTRALVYAANLIVAGLPPIEACRVAMVTPMTDDSELSAALSEIISAHFD